MLRADRPRREDRARHGADRDVRVGRRLHGLPPARLGPVDLARPQLEADGRWDDMRAAVRAHYERFNEADDGTFRASPRYFRILA
jgi:hypothetical protein